MYLCIMEINKKLYTLDEVYSSLELNQTIEFLKELYDWRKVWSAILDDLREDTIEGIDLVERFTRILEIEEQLEYLNKNIYTFENAVMCHETKIFQKRTLMGELVTFCLN